MDYMHVILLNLQDAFLPLKDEHRVKTFPAHSLVNPCTARAAAFRSRGSIRLGLCEQCKYC